MCHACVRADACVCVCVSECEIKVVHTMFHSIYMVRTSYLNCSSLITLKVLASTNVNRSSLLPTAIVFPLGLHRILIFSPLVVTVCVLLLAGRKEMKYNTVVWKWLDKNILITINVSS